jgi:hypothetical protein
MSWGKTGFAAFLSIGALLLGVGLSFAQSPAWVTANPLRREVKVAEGIVKGRVGQGIIDWAGGYIQVTALGAADPKMAVSRTHERTLATKTARLLAYEKLGEILNGIAVDSENNVGEELLRSSALRTSMRAIIRNAYIVEERSEINPEDNSIVGIVTLGVRIKGDLTRPILTHILLTPAPPPEKVYTPPPQVIERVTPPPAPTERVTPSPEEVATGLIIVAAGLGGEPAMAISIKTEPERKQVYGPHQVDREVAMNIGLADFRGNLEDARKETGRVGRNPMVVRAVKAEGKYRSDYLIAEEDAQRVVAANLKGGFLRQCRVMVILTAQ